MYSDIQSNKIPFTNIDWSKIPKAVHQGEKGFATWQTIQFSGLRLRIVKESLIKSIRI